MEEEEEEVGAKEEEEVGAEEEEEAADRMMWKVQGSSFIT